MTALLGIVCLAIGFSWLCGDRDGSLSFAVPFGICGASRLGFRGLRAFDGSLSFAVPFGFVVLRDWVSWLCGDWDGSLSFAVPFGFCGASRLGFGVLRAIRLLLCVLHYLITIRTYGTRLHGSEKGSVDRFTAVFGARDLAPNADRVEFEAGMMAEPAFTLDTVAKREQVLDGLHVACRRNQSVLWAAHVRVEHLHVVVETDRKVERAMADLKAWATRMLRRAAPEDVRRNYWARHGSTRYLFNRQSVQAAVVYVIKKQGTPMTTYLHPEW